MLQSYYLRNTSLQRFYFSTIATPKGFVQLKCRFDHLWNIGTQESEIRIDDVMLPQSVITSRLKYLNSRNGFFKEMNNFSLAKTNASFYQQALYDLLRLEETYKQQSSINISPEYLQFQGFQIQFPIDELSMTATKFQFQIQSTTYSIGFLSTVIAQIATLGEQFQDIAFVNIAHNLKQLLLTKIRRNQNTIRKIQELFETFAKVFEKNDYLSQSQPQHIANILGDLNEIMITYHIELEPQFQKSFAKSAQSFVNKYAEMQYQTISLKLNIIDYKNMIYTVLLAEQKPESITSSIINEIANCGIEYGHLAQIIELMSMLLLYKIPCTELFLKKIQQQQQKKGRFTVIQLFIIIKSFEQAQVPLNEFSHFLFNEMLQFVYQDKQLVEFNQVLMMARVLKDIFQSSFITSRQAVEKRNDKLIPYFEKLINRFPQQANFNNVLFIANTINQQLKIPNFLIDLLHAKTSEIEINSQTISLYKEFLEITHNFYKQKFQYFLKNDSREKANFLPSIKYTELVNIIMTKLIDEHLDLEAIEMYTHMINIMHIPYFQISLPKATLFFETVFKIPTIRQHIDIVTRSMLIQQIQFESFPQIQEIINQNLETNHFLESYYNLLEGLGKESRNQMKNVDILKNTIIKLIEKNADFLVTERIVENVTHTFPSFIQLHTFENYQFILPIMDMLDITLSDQTMELLQLQLNKMIKSFNGNILIQNLILFKKYNIYNYDTFIKAAENITTSFYFNREIGSMERNGLLASDEFVYQLVQAYLFQIEQSSFVASENIKIVSYLASVIFDHLNHKELLLLCKMLGNNQNLYYPELLTQLKKIKVQFPSILEFTQMFTIFNPNIRSALQKYLKLHPPQSLSIELMQSLTNNHISLPHINELFNKMSEQHKITFLPFILEYLIKCWDCNENIDDILHFAKQQINHINLQEKCSFVILSILKKAMKYTQITNEVGYFKVSFNKNLFQLEEEEIKTYQKILETHELLPNAHEYDGKSIPYYPSMTLEYDPNKLSTWKVFLTDQPIFNDRGKLLNFLQTNPDFEKQSVLHKISEYLGNLNLNDQLPISSYLTAIPKMNLEQKIALLKSDEDFLSFMICFTLSIPMNNYYTYVYQTQVQQVDQIDNIHILIRQQIGQNEQQCLKIQYASQSELIKNNEKSYLSPLLVLQALKLSNNDSIYYINFDEWIKLNPSRKKQTDFLQSLIDKL